MIQNFAALMLQEGSVETTPDTTTRFRMSMRRNPVRRIALSPGRVLLKLWIAGLVLSPGPTFAKDLKMLSRYLSGAYFIEDLAQRCALLDPGFLRETAGPRGDITVYTSAFEAAIAKGLNPQEIAVVVMTAKKAGALVATNLLSDVGELAAAGKAGAFEGWCEILRQKARSRGYRHVRAQARNVSRIHRSGER